MKTIDLKNTLQEINRYCEEGNRKALTTALRQVMSLRRKYYRESSPEGLEEAFSDALYKILILELDEEENDSIETAELAYMALNTVLLKESKPELYKRRLLLLHYFSDYLTDAIIEIFLTKYRKDNLLGARQLAIECIEKMQLSDMFWLEENYPDFLNTDEQLTDACNAIETDPDLPEGERESASLMHKVLYAYLKAKYKN